jgi:hypothetical protein
MASLRPDGPDFISPQRPVWYHQISFLTNLVLVALLLVLFAVKKPFGGIFQAVLNSAVPTRPEQKRSSLDLRLENTVCWLVAALTVLMLAETLIAGVTTLCAIISTCLGAKTAAALFHIITDSVYDLGYMFATSSVQVNILLFCCCLLLHLFCKASIQAPAPRAAGEPAPIKETIHIRLGPGPYMQQPVYSVRLALGYTCAMKGCYVPF